MAEDFGTWISKVEAAKTLGIGIRTLERRIQEQGLRVAHRRIPNRKPLAVLHPEDFAQLQAEMMPATPAPIESDGKEIAVRSISRPTMELVALLRSVTQAAPSLPLFLDIKSASAYSGLPQTYLEELIDQNKLKAVKRPRWTRISRLSLDQLAH